MKIINNNSFKYNFGNKASSDANYSQVSSQKPRQMNMKSFLKNTNPNINKSNKSTLPLIFALFGLAAVFLLAVIKGGGSSGRGFSKNELAYIVDDCLSHSSDSSCYF